MTDRVTGTLTIENAQILFRNFAGKEGMYNREGDRNFCVLLENDAAEEMARDGWNIKYLKPREDDEEPMPKPYLQVSVGYKARPPLIAMITSRGRVDLSEHEVEVLDWVDLKNVDLIIRPYNWAVSGKTGVKAYLSSIFITIQENYLEQKYAEVEYATAEDKALTTHRPMELNAAEDIVEGEIVEEEPPWEE